MKIAPTADKAILLSSLACVATAQLLLPDPGSGPNIVGGSPARPGEFPWYATPGYLGTSCGGALINSEWILTAAHCFDFWNGAPLVRVSVEDLTDNSDGLQATRGQIVPHPNHNPSTRANDVMLVKFSPPITTVTPIAYARDSSPADGIDLTVMGFGETSFGGSSSPSQLLKVVVTSVNINQCIADYGGGLVIPNIMMCAADPGEDSCRGDSGGPIVRYSKHGPPTVVGVVSWGDGCAKPGKPGVYARVGAYASWIQGIAGASKGGGNKDSARRRMLETPTARSLRQDDKDYDTYLQACGELEYEVSLHVDPQMHLHLLGSPKDKKAAAAAKCPYTAAVHAIMEGNKKATKEIVLWDNAEEANSMFLQEDLLSVGTFKVQDMARAFETAEPDNNSSTTGVFYDVVTNNCGSFLVNLAKEMGVNIDTRMTSFVARRLLANSGQKLANKVRDSYFYQSLFGDHNLRRLRETTAEEIVDKLVAKTVGNKL